MTHLTWSTEAMPTKRGNQQKPYFSAVQKKTTGPTKEHHPNITWYKTNMAHGRLHTGQASQYTAISKKIDTSPKFNIAPEKLPSQ